MKSLIYKKTERNYKIRAERVIIYVLGLCIYIHEYPMDAEEKRRNIGFNQFPSSAPTEIEDEDYYPDED